MTAPGSIMASLAVLAGGRHWRLRWAVVLGALAICGGLAVFPRQYRAAALLAPAALVEHGSGRAPGQPFDDAIVDCRKIAAEIGLATAQSAPVRARAAALAHIAPALQQRLVIVRSARGGLVLIEAYGPTPAAALALVGAHVSAMQSGLVPAGWMPIDPPRAEAGVPLRWSPLAIGALLVLLASVVELYRARPPVGSRRR